MKNLQSIETPYGVVHTGDKIKIESLGECEGADLQEFISREDKTGTVIYIDALGQLHGTWGCLVIIPKEDKFKIL